MFKDFDEILRGFTTEEYAYALHVTLISYLDSIGILNQDRYYKFLNTNFENTLKDVHQVLLAYCYL